MRNARNASAIAGIVVLTGSLLAGAVQLQAARERAFPAPAVTQDEALYLTSGSAVRRLSGAFTTLAADVYWVRAVQYFGGTKRRLAAAAEAGTPPAPGTMSRFEELYPLLDITTSLDPRFNIAYRFGAVFLAEPYPGGPGRPDLAIQLLEKGLRARPDKWEYMQDIGFVHYWYNHDYEAAAAWFDKGSRVAGAPWWLKSLAATTLAKGGDRRSSRTMWEAIRQSAEIDWLRRDAERRLTQLNALDQIDALQAAVDKAAASSGRPIRDWAPVVRANRWPGTPADPAGTAYELTPEGRVRMSQSSPLWPLPTEPERMVPRPPS